MRHIQHTTDKILTISNALQTAREEGIAVVVGQIPQHVRLICFDMDSTIVKSETINEIADTIGIGSEMKELTLRAMEGKDDFRTSFIKRVKMLQGVPVSKLQEIASSMPLASGMETLMKELHNKGIQSILITGNFSIFGNFLKEKYNFTHVYTTIAEVKDGTLTGDICGDIIDAPAKSSILIKICSEKNIPLECTIAVGDGANDIPMLCTAGTAIAYNAMSAKEGLDHVILPLL